MKKKSNPLEELGDLIKFNNEVIKEYEETGDIKVLDKFKSRDCKDIIDLPSLDSQN